MVNPKIMCKKHIIGEHGELHVIAANINKKRSIKGYLEKGLIEPASIHERHRELVKEMLRRGYNHNSDMPDIDFSNLDTVEFNTDVDENIAIIDLISRCDSCRKRYERFKK